MPGVLCVSPRTQGPSPALLPQPPTTLTHPLSFQPRRRRFPCSPLRTGGQQGALGEYQNQTQHGAQQRAEPCLQWGHGASLSPGRVQTALGLCPLAQKVLSSLLGWGPELALRGKKLGEAAMGMTGLCKFHPCSSLGSSVPLVAWLVGQLGWVPRHGGWGWALAATFDKAPFPFSGPRPSRTGSPQMACRPLSWPTWQVMPGARRGSLPCPGRGCRGAGGDPRD